MTAIFKPNSKIKVHVDVLGGDRAPLLIIDDFAAEPDEFVDLAVTTFAQGHRCRDTFPGIVAAVPKGFSRSVFAFLEAPLRRVFGMTGPVETGGFDFQLITVAPEDRSRQQWFPHYDVPDVNVLASVYFLCGPPHPGTAFYRHKSTGFEIISPERVSAYEAALQEAPPHSIDENHIDSVESSLFERIAEYPARYNRLIFFSAASLHSGLTPVVGHESADAKSGRLTANMFLKFSS